jgi:hypothetical protein
VRRQRQQGVDDLDRRQTERSAEERGLELVAEPAGEGLMEQPEATRQPVAADQPQRKSERALPDGDRDRDQRDLAPRGGRDARRRTRQRVRSVCHEERDQVREREAEAGEREEELKPMVAGGVGHVALYTSGRRA